jgi:formylglycine-generating enzyme required for sulfatase activity
MVPPSMNTQHFNPIDHAEMVWIDPGDCVIGSTDADITAIVSHHPDWRADWFVHEKPQRTVSLTGFWINRFPITVAQFRACCLATGWNMPVAPEWGWQDDHPMVNVSWQDVIHYTTWAQAMIPTETQWEKAARGADGNIWPWGNTWIPDNCSHATNASSTQPIGSHPDNTSPYGVRDMVGNVWEWCQASPAGDYERAPSRTPQRRPSTSSGHVLRGGSWQCAYEAYLRCAYRCFECDTQRGHSTYRRPTVGFRCVISGDFVQ